MGSFPYSLPDVALVDVDLSTLGEVEVFRPGVAVVDYELYWSIYMNSTSLIFTAT